MQDQDFINISLFFGTICAELDYILFVNISDNKKKQFIFNLDSFKISSFYGFLLKKIYIDFIELRSLYYQNAFLYLDTVNVNITPNKTDQRKV